MVDKTQQLVKCPHCGKEGELEKSLSGIGILGLVTWIWSKKQKPTICPYCKLDVYKTYDQSN